jgi:hypothetical protein
LNFKLLKAAFYFAPSALEEFTLTFSWAVGPGYYISRPWRLMQKICAFEKELDSDFYFSNFRLLTSALGPLPYPLPSAL